MKILVCGGAGYIGSHMARRLVDGGCEVSVLDNLSTGHRRAVRWCELLHADLLDPASLERAFASRRFDAVMHFCARSLVGESVAQPYDYYANNVVGTLHLLQVMQRYGVMRLVFSSTAAVFGQPRAERIDEAHPKAPINPYGASKLMVERILADAAAAYGLRSVALRYFNAAGASADGAIGESHHPETHLIPNVLRAALGSGPGLKVFGDDYPTRDGTCVRDYVHVDDLAQAHRLALEFMDASTLGPVLRSRSRLATRGRRLTMRAAPRCARLVLKACDLSDLIEPSPVADGGPDRRARTALQTWVEVPREDDPAQTRVGAPTFDLIPGSRGP